MKVNSNAAVLLLRLSAVLEKQTIKTGSFHLPKRKGEDQEKEKKTHPQNNRDLLKSSLGWGRARIKSLKHRIDVGNCTKVKLLYTWLIESKFLYNLLYLFNNMVK